MTPWSCPSSGRPRTSAGRIQKRSETDDRNSEGVPCHGPETCGTILGKPLYAMGDLLFEVKEAGSAAELQKQIEGEMDFLGKILETLEVPTQEQLEAKRR